MAAPFNNNNNPANKFNKPAAPAGPRPDNRFGRGGRRVKEELHSINEKIRAREVRVVGEGIEPGVYPIAKALDIAREAGLDLVEISPNAEPPVCKVIDYKKFLYDQKKKQKELKAKAQKTVIKEIRFGPQTDDHDFNFKKNHAIKFLQDGSKVKAFVFFKGRSIVFKEQGEILLLRFANELEEYGKPEQLPLLEGKKMIMVIGPKKK
ncbi:MAG: translation initiation factor IF-3 [Bacteroidia bacterium]|nr:translation initiation factor IF-3 [Bacteroidia bacterium]